MRGRKRERDTENEREEERVGEMLKKIAHRRK